MTYEEAEREMVEGFMDGYKLDNPDPSSNRSASYRHGFANGRRDKGILKDGLFGQQLRDLAEQAILRDIAA